MADNFANEFSGLNSPGYHAVAITPNDGANLATDVRGIYVGVGGDIKVDVSGGETAITFKNVPQGSVLAVRVTKVYATGTAATNLIGLY